MDISITGTQHATHTTHAVHATHGTMDARYSHKPTPNSYQGASDHATHSHGAAAAEHDTVTLSAQAIARLEMKIDASQEQLDAPSGEPAKSTEVARAGLVMELQSLNHALAKALKDQSQASA